METKTRWNSCRLAPYGDSGRVRWCVGHERAWRLKLKLLIFVPILLLSVTIIAILLSHFHKLKYVDSPHTVKPARTNFHDTERTEDDERHLLSDTKTSFIPTNTIPLLDTTVQSHPITRRTRDIRLPSFRFKKRYNLTDYDYPFLLNKSEDYEDFQISESKIVTWSMPNAETKITSQRIRPNMMELDETASRADKEATNREQLFLRERSVSTEKVLQTQAAMMTQYMDTAVNPCDDFYEYACGNWGKYNKIPPDKASYDTFEILRENLDAMLRDLLMEDSIEDEEFNIYIKDKHHFKEEYNLIDNLTEERHHGKIIGNIYNPVTKAKLLYRSCMNEDLINRRGEKPLLKLLQKLGGWPILEPEWDESNFDWLLLIAQLRLYNNDILISEWVGPDIKNSDEYVIQFDQTSLGLPTREYFLDDSNLKYLEAYRVYMITVANLLGASITTATQDVDEMIDFEIQLAKITASQDDRRNVSEIYFKVTVGELQAYIPQIDWLRYLNIVVDVPISANQSIICFSAPYFQDLVTLLSFTPSRTIANYLLWRFVRHRVNNLDKRFQDAKQRFYFVLFGREKMPPRWQTCITQVNSNMGMAVGKLFVEKYFDEKSKNDTLYMTKEIKQAFGDLLVETAWLDSSTKDLARLKIDAMKLRIGYPEFILNMEELAERYKYVEIHPNLYFENTLSILQHLCRSEQKRIFTAVNKTLWDTAPAIVNAYYSRNKNQIMFPAGILQPPFYHKNFPRCLNYGGIGVVIGHEITHGFDDKGRLFDKEGNLHRWWRQHAIEEFHDRAQCLIDQYNTYTVPEINMQVDGISTQGENIADNGGIKQAYKAYTKWLNTHPRADETLPGLNLTNKQLFFLNFAQVWCGISRPDAARNKLKTAVHSPGRFRVIGTLSNSHEFSEAYSCAPRTPMNPEEKCRIW